MNDKGLKFLTPIIAILFSYHPSSYYIYGRVSKVSDGDSITLQRAHQFDVIRLVYIDAPELEQGTWGDLSHRFLEGELLGRRVKVKVVGRGYYGRILGEVFHKARSLNLEMLSRGFAMLYPWSLFDSVKKKAAYLASEAQAKALSQGVWQDSLLAPWKWRRKQRKIRARGNL